MIAASVAQVILLSLLSAPDEVRGEWFNSEDMELFDLVEEVNGTFYSFLGVEPVSPCPQDKSPEKQQQLTSI